MNYLTYFIPSGIESDRTGSITLQTPELTFKLSIVLKTSSQHLLLETPWKMVTEQCSFQVRNYQERITYSSACTNPYTPQQ